MKAIKNWVVRNLGLRGSWKWACKQMQHGKIVRPSSATGAVCYKLDNEGQGRILWAFKRKPEHADFENAYIFLKDFEATDWVMI